ncbi:hypothetical protein IWX90DRAFT_495886 [Phyllosticta citrichinensis]|uniref:NACHT domain-containing protein n=1 Tax=Phyllosticta citrichinensis TaxID=1130410 RepID=A0ABR1XFJ0_9PEZI
MKAYSGRGKWLVSYYESKPQYLGPIPSCPVVSKWSATLDGGENIPIDGSHREIHKFESRDDPVYKKLMEKLLALAKGFPNPTREQKGAIPSVASLADRECEQSFLAKLQDAGGAACRQGEEDTVCVKGTREKLPREILDWVESTKPNDRVFWLEGKAGTGKSTIARTVADSAKSRLTVGRFLFQRGKGDLSRAKYFVTTNARQLAGQHNLQSVIADAQTHLSPLAKPGMPRILLVIDALDECEPNGFEKAALLSLLSSEANFEDLDMKVFITARPEESFPATVTRRIVLQDMNRLTVANDIHTFLESRFGHLRGQKNHRWLTSDELDTIVHFSTPLFIAAETTFRFITLDKHNPRRRFDILCGTDNGSKAQPALDRRYLAILRCAIEDESPDVMQLNLKRFRSIIGAVMTLKDRLTSGELSALLSQDSSEVESFLGEFQAVLIVPKPPKPVSTTSEPSVYGRELSRFGPTDLWINERKAHASLLHSCLGAMEKHLKEDICNLQAPGGAALDVSNDHLEEYIPANVRYACRFWIVHSLNCKPGREGDQRVLEFLQQHLLHWIEVISCLRNMTDAVRLIDNLKEDLKTRKCPSATNASPTSEPFEFTVESQRFMRFNRQVIEEAPLQLYSSARLFCPKESAILENFKTPKRITNQPRVADEWDATIQILEGHRGFIADIKFSCRGTIVSKSHGGDVMIWDAETGALQQRLQGYRGDAKIAVSKGDLLAYSTGENQLGIWNIRKVKQHGSLPGRLPAFSSDGGILASVSVDNAIQLQGADDKTWARRIHFECLDRSVEEPIQDTLFDPHGHYLQLPHYGVNGLQNESWNVKDKHLFGAIDNKWENGFSSTKFLKVLSNIDYNVGEDLEKPAKKFSLAEQQERRSLVRQGLAKTVGHTKQQAMEYLVPQLEHLSSLEEFRKRAQDKKESS